jgi:hypothetical protein
LLVSARSMRGGKRWRKRKGVGRRRAEVRGQKAEVRGRGFRWRKAATWIRA